jgi:hypothetical protein
MPDAPVLVGLADKVLPGGSTNPGIPLEIQGLLK